MIDRLTNRVPHRWLIPVWITIAAAAVGALVGIDQALRAIGQDPLVWLGWALISIGVVSGVATLIELVTRHVTASRTPSVAVPEWLHHDWHEMCQQAGIETTPAISQYAGITGMTTIGLTELDQHRLWIRPALVDHPRPLVRYTLAVQAVMLAAHLTTTRATVLHAAGTVLSCTAWILAGSAAITGTTGLLLATIAVILAAGFLTELADTLGQRAYTAADYITQIHLGIYPTGDLAAAADASPTWRYARFEPDLDSRDLHTPTELATTSHLDATSQGPADRGGQAHRQLPTGVSAAAPWTIIQGGGER